MSIKSRYMNISPEDSAFPEDSYRGEYIQDIENAYLEKSTIKSNSGIVHSTADIADDYAIKNYGVHHLRKEQDQDLAAFKIHFDVYSLEPSFYKAGKIKDVITILKNKGHTYEKDGVLWLKTTSFGDDKNRVMQKSNGAFTYFVPDIAYNLNKWERSFKRVINEQGSDHHSTVNRVKAGLQGLAKGIPVDWQEYVLHQMITVIKNGQEVKISKRAGSYVTLRDLIDEVGCDATRYFLVARRADSQLVFDIDLAKSQNSDNPVYYIQYAHARIQRVLIQWGGDFNSLRSLQEYRYETLIEKKLIKK
eukprot:GHVR01160733.1.p1 GENE.GHVR01160733.1~~GHVR01160733.1.p1  ORF type:complete len:305 (+),score=18.45 GHVR01160733.1:7099-8013(+)